MCVCVHENTSVLGIGYTVMEIVGAVKTLLQKSRQEKVMAWTRMDNVELVRSGWVLPILDDSVNESATVTDVAYEREE